MKLLGRALGLVLLALATIAVVVEAETDKKVKSSAQPEAAKRRGHPALRGRRRNVWSYNLGHRSLAFLVSGDVEVGTPPPGTVEPGLEYRCLGCCGAAWSPSGTGVDDQDVANAIGNSVLRREGLTGLGAEPNSVTDRCLGCCREDATPTPWHGGGKRAGDVAGAERGQSGETASRQTASRQTASRQTASRQTVSRQTSSRQTASRQQTWQTEQNRKNPCGRQGCPPRWGSESSSSSEEDLAGVRGRGTKPQAAEQRPGDPCRFLGCRSPLGSFEDSSSEED